jgi:hypothetical protein
MHTPVAFFTFNRPDFTERVFASSVKRCRMVHETNRLWKVGVRDVVMEVCCARHNLRVYLTPWQPMV